MSHHIGFELANGTNKFHPGETISGVVTFNLHKDITGVEEVSVEVKGFAYVHWTERRKRNDEYVTVKYSAKRTYIKTKVTLLNGDSVSNEMNQEEQHSYNFSFLMRTGIPASFEYGTTGHVRYFLKGKIKRSLFHSNIKGQHQLKCLGDTPLPLSYLEPLTMDKKKTLGIFCCKQGPIKIRVSTDKSGYLPGEDVIVQVEVDNESSTEIDWAEYELTRIITFKAEGRALERKNVLAETSGSGWYGNESKTLKIPKDCVPSGLPHCTIIDVYYRLIVKVVVPGCHVSPVVKIPFTIASPIRQQQMVQTQPFVPQQPFTQQPFVQQPYIQQQPFVQQPVVQVHQPFAQPPQQFVQPQFVQQPQPYPQSQPFVQQPYQPVAGFSPMVQPSAPIANEMGKPPIENGSEEKPFVSDAQPPTYDEAVKY